ncbi:MAG: EamA/RhaT family transporter [Myroides sp.]
MFVIVFVNYAVAIIVCYLLFNYAINLASLSNSVSYITLSLGILMPSIFYFLNKSLNKSGLAKTDIFQRLSLIIPVILSFWLFQELFTWAKFTAIALAFISIVLLLYKKSTKDGNFNTLYLIAVFIGYGTVDTLFKILATNKNIPYIAALFLVFIFCAVVSGLYLFLSNGKIKKKFIFYGFVLGILNFSNIYFYMKAHKIFSDSPTLVFITMNLGVIIGGSLIGKFYFKEKLTNNAVAGIVLAVISVILLALIQIDIL